ncbi:ABC-type antimicrobial peptide transport system, ATPase component [Methanomethylovorans hollandica DSM 15978]|uniref:ABC-type antimicrobial peptide transport system, ATPase component n=1 Tax=Methanomethylovorans hollandica (strain DSM 15978 / NBRC 107637 / DMS1) TaxID=867904 RepID=L0KXZ6_METHD|nr:ABC transporter ATP-binding protein [Methanomethylovorans hollandica]AGB49996.1 ABC-type antimicrobial peptide transport system, ATPase component [Methanomethylovorans hollandica DSM 15978]
MGTVKIIIVKDLKRYYGTGKTAVKALNGVSFEIKKGEFVAIMGASGSGKTTLLRILALLDDATDGIYTIRGLEVSSLPEAERSYYRLTQVGYVFQDYALINEMSAAENVYVLSMMEGKSKKESYRTALEALAKVGLNGKHDRVPDELSGGEKQRVAIARAIAKKPDIMFADEPCANLDTNNSKQVLDVFKELNEKYGQTIIMVTHEPWHVEYVNRVITLEDGIMISDEIKT